VLRIFGKLGPKFLRILSPGYHPSNVPDPAWMRAWTPSDFLPATGGS